MDYPYAAYCQRTKSYLFRSILTGPQALSPIPEFSEAGDSGAPLPPASRRSPLPELIVERQRRYGEEESEAFYNRLEVKIKRIYRKLFLGEDTDVNSSPSLVLSGDESCDSRSCEETQDGAGSARASSDDRSSRADLGRYDEGIEEEATVLLSGSPRSPPPSEQEDSLQEAQEEEETESTPHLSASPRSPAQSEQDEFDLREAPEDLAQEECNLSEASRGRSSSEPGAAEGELGERSQSQTFTEEPRATTTPHTDQGETEATPSTNSSLNEVEVMRSQRTPPWSDSLLRRSSLSSEGPEIPIVHFTVDRSYPEVLGDSVLEVSSASTPASPILGRKRSYQATTDVSAETPFDATAALAAKKRREDDQQAAASETAGVKTYKDASTNTEWRGRHVATQTRPETRDQATQTGCCRYWWLGASR